MPEERAWVGADVILAQPPGLWPGLGAVLGKRAGGCGAHGRVPGPAQARQAPRTAGGGPRRCSAASRRNFRPGSDTDDVSDAEGCEMSTNRSRRIDRDTAEQLLGDAGAAAVPGDDALTGLLAAVSAPAGDGELPGGHVAMAAFRSARLAQVSTTASTPVATPRKRNMLTPAMLLCAKVAATVAAAALGGVAVAAGTGNLPAALGGEPASSAPVPSASAPASKPGDLPPGARRLTGVGARRSHRALPCLRRRQHPGPAEARRGARGAPFRPAGRRGRRADRRPVLLRPRPRRAGRNPRQLADRAADGRTAGASASPKPSGKHEADKQPGDPEATRTPGGPGGRPTGRPSTGTTPPQPRNDTPTTHPNP